MILIGRDAQLFAPRAGYLIKPRVNPERQLKAESRTLLVKNSRPVLRVKRHFSRLKKFVYSIARSRKLAGKQHGGAGAEIGPTPSARSSLRPARQYALIEECFGDLGEAPCAVRAPEKGWGALTHINVTHCP
jgi:hypothetical protein